MVSNENKQNKIEEENKVFFYRKISLWILYAGPVFSFVMTFILWNAGLEKIAVIMLYGIIVFLAVFIIMSLLFWRCPNCGKHFEIRHSSMDKITICPFCGTVLRDRKK